MANISTYTTDTTIDPADKVIGTDGATLAHPVVITGLLEAANDSAAATAGVAVGGIYKTSGQLKVRVS